MLGMGSTYHRLTAAIACGLACLGLWAASAGAAEAAGAATLIVEGAGDGHGVGMSQDGAQGFALHGWTYEQILAHYYTGTTIGQAPAGRMIKVLEGSKVVSVPLERYVRGVVSAEMPASSAPAALEAQAIASRTYALTSDAGGTRFDVYSDTRSQVYMGAKAETASSNAAVSATTGQIVLYDGKPATTYFFASSGGETESIQNSFIGAEPEPWLVGVSDPYDAGPGYEWKDSFPFSSAASLLHGLLKGSFRGIEVLTRGVSPRIVTAEILGSKGRTPVSGPELAGRLGLMSTWARFSVRRGAAVTPEPDLSGHATAPPVAAVTPPPLTPAPTAPATSPQGGAQAPGVAVTSAAGGTVAG